MLLLLLALAAEPTPLERCLETAHATRPRQHCQNEEISRRDDLIAQAVAAAVAARPAAQARLDGEQSAWLSSTDERCFALSRENRGSLGSEMAMDCRLEAQEKRLKALGRPLGS